MHTCGNAMPLAADKWNPFGSWHAIDYLMATERYFIDQTAAGWAALQREKASR